MHQLQKENALMQKWKQESEKTTEEEILEAVSHEEWKSPSQIYEDYSYRKKDAVTRTTVTKYLSELERQGQLESKGASHSRKYRKADKPIQETRENYSSPLSEGLPDFMKKRIKKEVRIVLEEEIQRIDKRIEDKVKSSRKDMKVVAKGQEQQEKHNKLIMECLSDSEYRDMKTIMDSYSDKAEDPLSRRSVLRRLTGLIAENKLQKRGQTSQTEYRLL